MDYRSAILLALGKIELDVWNVEAATGTVKALVQRAAAGPIYAQEAVFIANAFPPYVNAATPPLSEYAGGAPVSFAPNVKQGIASWYWNNTVLPTGNLVTALYQYQIDGGAGVSAWMFTGGYCLGGTWTPFKPVFIANTDVTVTANGVVIQVRNFSFALAITSSNFTLTVISNDNQVEFTLTASSARGPTFEQANGNLSRTGLAQNAYWSVVDGVAEGSLRTDSGPLVFANAWSWLDYQQIGTEKPSQAQQFLLAEHGAVTSQPWMWVIVQRETVQVALFFSGRKKLQELADGKEVTAGTTNVWTVGQRPQLNVSAGTACVVEFNTPHGGLEKVPSKLSVTVGGQTYMLTCALTNIPEVFMPVTHTYDAICKVDVAHGESTKDTLPPSGLVQWRSSTFPLSVTVGRTQVSQTLARASNPSSFARMNLSMGIVSGVLIAAILVLVVFTAVEWTQGRKNTRDLEISVLVLLAVLVVFICVGVALYEKQNQKRQALRKECILNAYKYSVIGPSQAPRKA